MYSRRLYHQLLVARHYYFINIYSFPLTFFNKPQSFETRNTLKLYRTPKRFSLRIFYWKEASTYIPYPYKRYPRLLMTVLCVLQVDQFTKVSAELMHVNMLRVWKDWGLLKKVNGNEYRFSSNNDELQVCQYFANAYS